MDNIQKMAISKFNLTSSEKDSIPVGVHEYNFVAQFKGSCTRGEDTEKNATCSIPLLPVVALLIAHMGVTREKALEKIADAVRQSILLDKSAIEALLEESGVSKALKRIQDDVIAKLPKTPVKGGIYGKPVVTLVGIVEETTNIETGEVLRIVTSA